MTLIEYYSAWNDRIDRTKVKAIKCTHSVDVDVDVDVETRSSYDE